MLWHILTGKILIELEDMRRRYYEAVKSIEKVLNNQIKPLYKGPLVTVCIPARNEEKFIGQAIYLVKNGQYRNVEVIVIDNASTDKTREIATALGAKVIELDLIGRVGLARHICSLEARGEVIIQIDADTALTPYAISKAVSTLMNGEVKIYHVAHYYYDGNLITNLMAHYYDKYFRKPWKTTGHFIAYTKDLYNHVQFNPNALGGEDYEFGEKAYKRFGEGIFKFDKEITILVSSRHYKRQGLIKDIINNPNILNYFLNLNF